MNRRHLLTSLSVGTLTVGFGAGFGPAALFADGPDFLRPKAPSKGKGKASINAAPNLIKDCVRNYKRFCQSIQGQMNAISNVYKQMITDIDKTLKAGKSNPKQTANLKALAQKLMREYNALSEISTGKSAWYIKQGNKNIADDFCKRAGKYLDKAAKGATDMTKTKDDRRKKTLGKQAQKDTKTAHRILRTSFDAFYTRARNLQKALDKAGAGKADGTDKIYTKARALRIENAMKAYRNLSVQFVDFAQKDSDLSLMLR